MLLFLFFVTAWSMASTAQGETIVLYDVPITVGVETNITVPASVNGTAGSASANLNLPFVPSDTADIYLEYYLYDSNNSLLSSGDGISIRLSANGTDITAIYLSSGSPAHAVVPLTSTVNDKNLTLIVENTLASEVSANVKVIVIDTAKFNVSISRSTVEIPKGGQTAIDVAITQVSGPAGTLKLQTIAPMGIRSSVEPSRVLSMAGKTVHVNWTISADSVGSGTYSVKLVGTFQTDILNTTQEYTFAEAAIPIVVSGASGALLGSVLGASWGMYAVMLFAALLIGVLAFILVKR